MTVRDIEIQVTPPEKTNVAWVNPQDSMLRLFVNGKWRPVGDNGDLSKLEEKGIDTSGTFADTLSEIVDTIPEGSNGLVIEGTVNDVNSFTPASGQPSIQDVKEAVLAGKQIYIKYVDYDNNAGIAAILNITSDDGVFFANNIGWY